MSNATRFGLAFLLAAGMPTGLSAQSAAPGPAGQAGCAVASDAAEAGVEANMLALGDADVTADPAQSLERANALFARADDDPLCPEALATG
ncbi:hypothetical protein [Stakelama tenebrarum]|uniref:Uncharacterized protein n=1 Tax=Stakelama tenebrarum TaxID=2711215 RepID=A0A6G6Y428_9SPHN|nr:hypothetical protein [Sphingosinithalassobacter tenebrarum]QIG79601.1 hypothetical protein G5C33_07230 [Sphingosinithalassobacter tenebrarum]